MHRSNISQRNSSAICLANPMAAEIECTWKLRKYLIEANVFASQEDIDHRTEVLAQLECLVKSWIRSLPFLAANTIGGKLYTFGSHRMGVVSDDTEIDALCLAPVHVSRSDFFSTFYQLLMKEQQVSDLRTVKDAFIKMRFEGIEINLFFARLPLNQINKDIDLQDSNILTHLDDMCARSFNACRVTDAILHSVPNIESFRLTLSVIKMWAKRHDVYNIDFGYLGGASTAIMVAKLCQLFPNAGVATLVQKFFLVFSTWTWPNPVNLTTPLDLQLGFKVWNPVINLRDCNDLMPVITPSYPYLNSAFRVTPSARSVMTEEFGMSAKTCEDIMLGRANWKKLFQPINFFTKYSRYLVVVANARTLHDQQKWLSFVQTKIRFLLLTMELNSLIKTVRIIPRIFSSCHDEFKDKPHSCWFVGLDFEKNANNNSGVDLSVSVHAFMQKVYIEGSSTGIYLEGMQVHCHSVERNHLSKYVSQEELDRSSSQHIKCNEMHETPAG